MGTRVIEDVANVPLLEKEGNTFVYVLQNVLSPSTSYGDLGMKLRRVLEEVFFRSNFSYLINIRKRKASHIYNVMKILGRLQKCNYHWCRFSDNYRCSNPLFYESSLFTRDMDKLKMTIFGCSLSPEWRGFGFTLFIEKEMEEEFHKWKKDGRLWQRK